MGTAPEILKKAGWAARSLCCAPPSSPVRCGVIPWWITSLSRCTPGIFWRCWDPVERVNRLFSVCSIAWMNPLPAPCICITVLIERSLPGICAGEWVLCHNGLISSQGRWGRTSVSGRSSAAAPCRRRKWPLSWRRWAWWGTGSGMWPPSLVERCSVSRLHGPWRTNQRCSCLTNPHRLWTRLLGRELSGTFSALLANGVWPVCWLPTMRSRLGVWLEWRLFSEKGGWRRWGLQWRCSVLSQIFHNNLALGGAQAVAALVFALSVMFLARRWAIHMEREVVVSLIRGLVQIIAMGLVLVLLLQGPAWTSALVLAGMTVAAANVSRRRVRGVPGTFGVALGGIGIGAGSVIVLMTAAGVIEAEISSLVPVGSMIIASTMNSTALALERFRSDVEAHASLIEAGLALGAGPRRTLVPYVRTAVQAGILPHMNSLRSLGLVWIPGLMTGMVISGTDPVYAAIYQFVVIVMIFSSGGLAALVSLFLISPHVFSPAEQLLLHPQRSFDDAVC